MPRAHFECPTCGALYDIEYRSADVGAAGWPPECGECPSQPLIVAPQPGDYKIDLRSDAEGNSTRQKFFVSRQVPTRDGLREVSEEISSTRQIRQIEQESERRYINGEGEPLRFRAFSQNSAQMQESSYGTAGQIGDRAYDSGHTPQKKKNITIRRHGQDEPSIPTHRVGGVSPLE